MAHSILNNMEYIKKVIDTSHNNIEECEENEQPADTNRWHSIFRRMSMNIQRDEGTPDKEIVHGTPLDPSEHERALMLNIPHSNGSPMDTAAFSFEDDTLPTVEEVVRTDRVKEQTNTSYFEKPFHFDSTSTTASYDDTTHRPLLTPSSSHHNTSIEDHHPKEKKKNHHHGILYESPENWIQTDTHDLNNRAKVHWAKGFEKIKVVNAIASHSRRTSTSAQHLMTTKYPLAPYYPSLFMPGYLSLMCRDEYGRKAPPILFDVLNASITDSVIDQNASHRLWTFRIELQYGEIKWIIHRTIIEFYNLHLTLKFKYMSGFISDPPPSFPSQLAHLTNAALTSMRITREQEDGVWREVALKRRDALEIYLRSLIQGATLLVNYELCEFLELSAISIVRDMGWKGKEGYLEYNMNPNLMSSVLKWHRWHKAWFILRDSFLAICKDIGSTTPYDVILFDKYLKVVKSHSSFVGSIHQTHFVLSNTTRMIEIKAPTSRHIEEWIENLEKIQKESPWLMNHRFGSYAPIRENAKAKWFIDGNSYYEAVIEAILSAKSEIYIEDWWLSPQLYLRRPPKGNEEYRLDRLLKRKAYEGVMIYIVIYKNVSVALPLDSQHTRDWMQSVHPNIIVQRHANLTSSPFWAHHEKILVIDNKLAFVGGLDLCFGRYDTQDHKLTDYYPNNIENEIFPGQDYSNPRIKDFIKVSQYDMELIDKRCTPRMPWHDIHTAMIGQPARDVARHFIQRWNFIKSNRSKERNEVPFLLPKGEYVSVRDELKFKGTCRIQVLRSSAEWSQGIIREYSIYSAYMECIFKAKHFIYIENQFFITTTSPHDKLIKNKIGQAIVERIKRAHQEKEKFRVIVVIPVAPGFEGDFTQVDRKSMPLRSVAQYQYRSISRGKYSVFEQLRKANIPIKDYIGFYSLRNWSKIKRPASVVRRDEFNHIIPVPPPLPPLPASITNKRNLLNKKLMKSRSGQSNSNEDLIPSQQRQKAALLMQQGYDDGRMDFITEQIYIHSKLMIVDDKIVICGSANLNDRSQLGNRDSEIAVLIEDTDLVDSQMNGKPYKASRYALSLRMQLFKEHLGLLNCTQQDNYEYFGYRNMKREDIIVMDPLHDEFYYDIWNKTAEKNTLIYRDVFRCVPDDTVHTFEQHRHFVPDPMNTLPGHIAEPWNNTNEQIQSKLEKIQGHLVEFPTEYMKNVNMTASVMQEAVPPIVFT
ncbi:uncharacterized protein BX663DRAFT_516053 [Cokeromyces recurvatus]|uniref:uncharacterized protein n=1 Tax=Cokeromyces recurvatus TaxID=90255 RepID=UPI00221F77CB|nr:uncharacterized protein BX663DRAFT_516053 [Cokeromyces recurvatus]KAI7901029.1 hypothetical protein BX663DRAFT_516053 [Cokeromyces recurvatus]